MRILVISSIYPSNSTPQVGTFVYKLVQEFANQKNDVIVICPRKISFSKKIRTFYGEEKATVYRPLRLSFSNKRIGFINTFHLTNFFRAKVIRKTISSLHDKPDIIYCHFIISAINYFQACPESDLPVYVGVGEYHNIDVIRRNYSPEEYSNYLNKVRGFIAVSPQVEKRLLSLGIPRDKIIVEPNATDLDKFSPRGKLALKKRHNIPINKKVVLFVGRFIESKGPLRVLKALDTTEEDVVAVFIGSGPQHVKHPKLVFSGSVEHEVVAEFMSLADVFVLPTLHEGSSNVIVEAMASGLPIVSSNIPEVRYQCSDSYATLIDPLNTVEIGEALNNILNNEKVRTTMSYNALQASKRFDLKERARRILNFFDVS